jgi:uncharacterized membrane protein
MTRINPWLVLLLMSVLLNGVLLGAGARTFFAAEPAHQQVGERGPGRGFDLRAFMSALPESYQDQARQRAASERRALRADLREAGRARRVAVEALNADPFDADAAAEALAEARAARDAIESRAEALILEFAGELSVEDRRLALSAALGPQRFGPRGARRTPPDR